jgi:IS5 family transposase
MLRTRAVEVSLWEAVLPAELARVDALLDDPVFFSPFVAFFNPRLGRPSTPMGVYLRLMFLKFRYQLSYETLSVRSRIRSPGGGSAGSRSTATYRTRPP